MSAGWAIVAGVLVLVALAVASALAGMRSRRHRELIEDERRIWGEWGL